MQSRSLLLITAIVSSVCFDASAASIDFRHEYKGETDQHASRIKMGNTFDNNLSISLELKFKGENGEFMDNLQSNGTEIDVGYKIKLNDEWTLAPGMPIEFGNSGSTYKPQIRLTYQPAALKGWSFSGRYRLDLKPGEDIKRYRHRYTANIVYKYNLWSFNFEGNYYYADNSEYLLYDDDRTNYENNLTINYKMGKWTPWVEFGDVSISNDSNDRELRSRVGIRYSF
ncbi:oligogalacturonate-specific porin KdgM family protein [Shewanella gaetbuli]|uniref:Oligogalacturonate-specific porin KdgM family protein n=1 Tax=Shewanella gaetbuli TaxID=220752 RepID=A0A9X2CHM3_9GAMM|nr:oligogalacturonate-specific porin KdgM family protein [Shewanella gaetbuli]MCL1142172.1 oligogalacturonate-specific porin KdgM family protein [Shewanella gaetbuli]